MFSLRYESVEEDFVVINYLKLDKSIFNVQDLNDLLVANDKLQDVVNQKETAILN